MDLAATGGENVPLFVAAVMGGAFFGDNLSFISDTTIASTRTQGVAMSAKFRANLRIVLPAAIVTLAVYAVLGASVSTLVPSGHVNPWLILPYLVIIGLALTGLNVTVVLVSGILVAAVIAVCHGYPLIDLAGYMGTGIDSMGDLIIITLLSACMLGIIRETGGSGVPGRLCHCQQYGGHPHRGASVAPYRRALWRHGSPHGEPAGYLLVHHAVHPAI